MASPLECGIDVVCGIFIGVRDHCCFESLLLGFGIFGGVWDLHLSEECGGYDIYFGVCHLWWGVEL